MAWVPCGGCEDFYCTVHGAHTADCECPEIQDWDTDPYDTSDPAELEPRRGLHHTGG